MKRRLKFYYYWEVTLVDEKCGGYRVSYSFGDKKSGDLFLRKVRTIDPAVADSAKCCEVCFDTYGHAPRWASPSEAFVEWQRDRARRAGLPPEEVAKITDETPREKIVFKSGRRFGFPVD